MGEEWNTSSSNGATFRRFPRRDGRWKRPFALSILPLIGEYNLALGSGEACCRHTARSWGGRWRESTAREEAKMLVPFGTHVVDKHGKSVGTVSRVVLDSQGHEVVSLVVHHGVLNRRQVEVPISKVTGFGDEVRLSLNAAEFNELHPFHAPNFRVMPDHWDMPVGFDQRSFFLVGGGAWAEATLPFEPTSPDVSGTPRYVRDPD